ncbi:MAG: hypothetical protein ACLGIC_01590 [Acidimicrobiia bacterium]
MSARRSSIGIIATAALLGACGGDDASGFADQPAADIVAAAEADMRAVTSLRMTGDLVVDGEDLAIDLALDTEGDCQGTLTQGGATAEISSVGGTSYLRPDAAFWETFAGEGASAIVELVGDRWVVVPGDDGDFSEFCDLDQLLEEIGSDDDAEEEPVVEGTEDVDGQEAVRISSTTDEGDPVTAWVATSEPHVILRIEVTEGDEPGTITFSEFDEELEIEAPPEDEVVDLAELGG